MKRNRWFVLAAIACLVVHLCMPLFARHQIVPVKFLVYGHGFKPGPTNLHTIDSSGRGGVVPVEIIKEANGTVLLKWKGNIPPGFMYLDRNGEVSLSERHAAEVEVIELPGVSRKRQDEQVKAMVICLAFVSGASNLKEKYRFLPKVSALYPDDMLVPDDFVNSVAGWNFPREYVLKNPGKLLTLDLDFGERCSLKCPHCFRHGGRIDASPCPVMSYEESMDVVRQGKELGLETVKILGAGEPFENRRFLSLLSDIRTLRLRVVVFTKGHVFADDNLSNRYFGISASDLVKEVAKLDVSVGLGFNSLIPKVQDGMVGVNGYTLKRNLALERLVEVGMNRFQPTQICIVVAPVTNLNIGEVLEINKWARERNLYPAITTSMCAGRASESWKKITPSADDIINLYTQVSIYNIEKGVLTLNEIVENGPSSYAGGWPCGQCGYGVYCTSRGIVLRCPGDDITVLGNIREKPLADIWHGSENCIVRSGMFNNYCPPKDGKSLPSGLYSRVKDGILHHFKA